MLVHSSLSFRSHYLHRYPTPQPLLLVVAAAAAVVVAVEVVGCSFVVVVVDWSPFVVVGPVGLAGMMIVEMGSERSGVGLGSRTGLVLGRPMMCRLYLHIYYLIGVLNSLFYSNKKNFYYPQTQIRHF